MKTSKHMRFFKNTTPFIGVGVLAALAGFLIYRYSWEIWMLGTPLLVVGVVLVIFGFSMRESGSSFMAYFDSKIESLTSGRHMEASPDYTASEHSFDGNKFSKFDSNQTPRSELFVRTDLYFGKSTLTVETFRVDAANDTIDSEKFEFPLTEAAASIENVDIHCRGTLKKAALMTITGPDGKSCTFPVRYNDIDVDTLTDKINKAKSKA